MNMDELTDSDIGKRVRFIGDGMEGIINGFDHGYVLVKYDGPIDNILAEAANRARGVHTRPEDLEFTDT